MKKFTILFPVLAAMAFSGCGAPTCKSLCEDSKSCKGDAALKECIDGCAESKKQAELVNCDSEFDDFLDCAEGMDMCLDNDPSGALVKCEKPLAKFIACTMAYCITHPDKCGDSD